MDDSFHSSKSTAAPPPPPPPPPPPRFPSSSSPSAPFSFASAELRRLQEEAEWAALRRLRAKKAAADWQRRQKSKRGLYTKWTQHRDSGKGEEEEREEEEEGGGGEGGSTGGRSSFYDWRHFDAGASPLLPSALLRAGEELGLPPPSLPFSASPPVLPLPPPSRSPSDPPTALWRCWSVDLIKAAFKRRALSTHPDMTTGDAAQFQRVAQAYDLLMHSRQQWTQQHRR